MSSAEDSSSEDTGGTHSTPKATRSPVANSKPIPNGALETPEAIPVPSETAIDFTPANDPPEDVITAPLPSRPPPPRHGPLSALFDHTLDRFHEAITSELRPLADSGREMFGRLDEVIGQVQQVSRRAAEESVRQAASPQTVNMAANPFVALQSVIRNANLTGNPVSDIFHIFRDQTLALADNLPDFFDDVPVPVPKAELDLIPVVSFGRTPEPLTPAACVICQSEYTHNENVRVLPCGHHMHQRCIDVWLEKKNTCPICRERVEVTPLVDDVD